MACRRLWECLLNLLNFLLTLTGLAMVGYGAYLLVEWNTASSAGNDPVSPTSGHPEFSKFGRSMIVTISLSTSILDKLPKACVTLFVTSCFGCIAAVTRNGCCLSFYSFLVALLILVELGAAAFILFDHSWKDYIPADVTGNFDTIYDFLEHHWKIAKWVALGAVVLEISASLPTRKKLLEIFTAGGGT
ncbi:tetraspanin family [Musa troglodytarum]|uniref:Tetraspanin family n=1 Tax=Musa troglodytarum TaxID=320322 RepID=A0A9E7EUP9_9LILI|nr:tetraspanin family [Musa troglodytarum]